MQIPKSIQDNLLFLCIEVDSQVASLQDYFAEPTATIARRILDRSGYAYNLKMRIHDGCVNRLACDKETSIETHSLRAVEHIATSLDRIAELGRKCIKHMQDMQYMECLYPDVYDSMLERVRRGIDLVEPAIQGSDTHLALKISQIERKLDRNYNKLLKRYIAELKDKKHTEDLTNALFVARNVEQMGNALLDVSESIISANLGQPLNLESFHSLQQTVEDLDEHEDVQVEPIAETRSGSAISGITSAGAGDEYVAIYKEGLKHKLKEERQGVESWHEIYPGIAPQILSYKKRGESACLLIEHLPGLTFEQIVLHESEALLYQALEHLGSTLKSVWRETKSKKRVSANFIQQLQKRLDDVYKIHPEFRLSDADICGLKIPSFDSLMAQTASYEQQLEAPFSVYIHGDFNLDNIIYDPAESKINFIDLHRSTHMDYVQDVSVFMVSNYRLQVLDAPTRQRIMTLVQEFYKLARKYADKVGDDSFELRLALGLARSFMTSTRFILDKALAKSMYLRARFLLEQVLATDPKKAKAFTIPMKEIFIA